MSMRSGCKWIGKMSPENGIIFGTAMAEKRLENGKVRYSAAYPTGAERFTLLRVERGKVSLVVWNMQKDKCFRSIIGISLWGLATHSTPWKPGSTGHSTAQTLKEES